MVVPSASSGILIIGILIIGILIVDILIIVVAYHCVCLTSS
jgi:hypothetical protein